jgi:magnesium chelatase family protein
MNPCPCGYHGHASGKCKCAPDTISRYQGRISGPLLDRMDLLIHVNPLTTDELEAAPVTDSTPLVAQRVARAFSRQLERQGKCNQLLGTREVERLCKLDAPSQARLRTAMKQFQWSARAYHRVLRVARTIADLDDAKAIKLTHLNEAVQYRRALSFTT